MNDDPGGPHRKDTSLGADASVGPSEIVRSIEAALQAVETPSSPRAQWNAVLAVVFVSVLVAGGLVPMPDIGTTPILMVGAIVAAASQSVATQSIHRRRPKVRVVPRSKGR